MKEVDDLKEIGYTHNLKNKASHVLVGSTVDVRCKDETKRLEYDKYDNDPMDYKMTFVCKPTQKFNLPVYDWNKPTYLTFPRCLGWCPKAKPQPPPITGLYLSHKDSTLRYKYT